MPLEMPYDDLCRDLKGCVVMYKNKPVYVTSIGRDGTVFMLDLLSQREEKAPFTIKDFSAPIRRVGFVNCLGSCVYVSRNPIRQYYMGLCTKNLNVKYLRQAYYESGAQTTVSRVSNMMTPELGLAIMDQYPSIKDACAQLRQRPGAVAFDKQFCITHDGLVVYKGTAVGTIPLKTAKTSADIKWEAGQEHLSILLDNNHEKTVRDYRPKTC